MKKLFITKENELLLIREGNNEEDIIYQIRIKELNLVRDSNLSEWVMQILDKTWADSELLYTLAQNIQRICPENEINWTETFFVVEKEEYLDSLGSVLIVPEKENSTLMDQINFGIKESNKESEEIINTIVSKRLSEFGLN